MNDTEKLIFTDDEGEEITLFVQAQTELGGTTFKVYEARACEPGVEGEAGKPLLLTKQGLAVGCFDGAVLITRLQAQGGKVMSAPDYFRGHPIEI